MKTVKDACQLQPNALEINVGDQIEQLDQIISESNGRTFFTKTFITDGMKNLLSKGFARLSGKSNDSIFHLKQAMGGGKTHLMVGFGLLAKEPFLRSELVPDILYHNSFSEAKIATFYRKFLNRFLLQMFTLSAILLTFTLFFLLFVTPFYCLLLLHNEE